MQQYPCDGLVENLEPTQQVRVDPDLPIYFYILTCTYTFRRKPPLSRVGVGARVRVPGFRGRLGVGWIYSPVCLDPTSKLYFIPVRTVSTLFYYYYSSCHLTMYIVQHDLQHGSLVTFPKEENLGNKRNSMHHMDHS